MLISIIPSGGVTSIVLQDHALRHGSLSCLSFGDDEAFGLLDSLGRLPVSRCVDLARVSRWFVSTARCLKDLSRLRVVAIELESFGLVLVRVSPW